MAYAIMRCKKLKTGGAASSLSHTFRERDTPNADESMTPDNVNWMASSTDEAMGRMRDLLPDKFRKDAVVAVEYLFTTSPEWAETVTPAKQEQFFADSLDWLQTKHGAKNVFVATIHNDETTPHLAAYVVPRTPDGRLSAKEMLGDRKAFQEAQTSFAAKVQHLGLERGIKGSKATHQRIQQHYHQINQAIPETKLEIDPEELKPKKIVKGQLREKIGLHKHVESEIGVSRRINAKIKSEVEAKTAPLAAKARERDTAVKQAREATKTVERLEKHAQAHYALTKGLSLEQKQSLTNFSNKMQNQNQQEKERLSQEKRLSRTRKGPSHGL